MQPRDTAIEMLSDCFQGWGVEVIQLGPSRGRLRLSYSSHRSHRILELHAAGDMVVRGIVPEDSCCVAFSATRQAARVLGQPLGSNELLVAEAGAFLDLFLPEGASAIIVAAKSRGTAPRRAMRSGADTEGAKVVAAPNTRIRAERRLSSENVEALVKVARRAVQNSRTAQSVLATCPRRVAAVVSACRLLDSRFPAPITLRDLSTHCGVAERTLEYGFKQVYDTTPLAFFRSQRLTRNRMALQRAAAHIPISQTARACGFSHMGQYCRDYGRLFGETPSTTRARGMSLG